MQPQKQIFRFRVCSRADVVVNILDMAFDTFSQLGSVDEVVAVNLKLLLVAVRVRHDHGFEKVASTHRVLHLILSN